MLKNRQNIIKIAILIVGVVLVCVLAVFLFKKSHTGNNTSADGKTNVSEEVTDGTVDSNDEEYTHADALDDASEVEDEGQQILYLPKEEVSKFSITDSNGILVVFEKQGDKWIYVDDPTIEIDNDRAGKVLNYLCDIRFIDNISLDDECDAEEYGLSQESQLCIIEDAGGNQILISIGDIDEETGNVYFALNYDFNNVYVNSGKLANVCDYGIEEIIAL